MQFIKIFFLTSFLCLTVLLGFIYSIDPYDKYQINVFGFETKAVAMSRENKFNMIEHSRKDYQAFIIGSSAAHRFHTEDVYKATGLLTFNYALQHTTPEDYLAVTRHILSRKNPKLIILQIDFYALNENFKTDTRFYTSPLRKFLDDEAIEPPKPSLFDSDYFSIGALSDSFKVVWVNYAKKARHIYLEDGNYQLEKPAVGPIQLLQYSDDNYKLDSHRVELLKKIRAICEARNVELVVVTSPVSWEHYEKIQNDPQLKNALVLFKKTLVDIFGEVHDFTNEEVKNFNSTEYFQDSSHPTRKYTQIMLEKIFPKR